MEYSTGSCEITELKLQKCYLVPHHYLYDTSVAHILYHNNSVLSPFLVIKNSGFPLRKYRAFYL